MCSISIYSDGDMVEIVVRKTKGTKNSQKMRTSSECTEVSSVTEELSEPVRVVDESIIDVNGYDLNLDSLIKLG